MSNWWWRVKKLLCNYISLKDIEKLNIVIGIGWCFTWLILVLGMNIFTIFWKCNN